MIWNVGWEAVIIFILQGVADIDWNSLLADVYDAVSQIGVVLGGIHESRLVLRIDGRVDSALDKISSSPSEGNTVRFEFLVPSPGDEWDVVEVRWG